MNVILFAAAVLAIPAGNVFACPPTRVWDGDGPVWCEEGPRIRLAGIAAREMDESCDAGHPCPAASASDAQNALVALLGRPTGRSAEGHILVAGPTRRCRSAGSAGGKRTAAWCVSPIGGDVSCMMVGGAWAARWERHWKRHERT